MLMVTKLTLRKSYFTLKGQALQQKYLVFVAGYHSCQLDQLVKTFYHLLHKLNVDRLGEITEQSVHKIDV